MKRVSFLIIWCLFLAACAGEQTNPSSNTQGEATASEAPLPSILPMLQKSWVETRDSLHVIDLSDMKWTDIYNGDTVSVRGYQLYDKDPEKGGVLADHGRFLYLQEDSANFYLMEIEALDSNRLALHFLQAEIRYEFRLKAFSASN